MTTPTALRDEGMATATNAADPRLVLAIDALIEEFVASGFPFSANDIRDRVPVVSRGLVGARMKSASMRAELGMVHVGWTRSSLASTHAKPIAVWQGRP